MVWFTWRCYVIQSKSHQVGSSVLRCKSNGMGWNATVATPGMAITPSNIRSSQGCRFEGMELQLLPFWRCIPSNFNLRTGDPNSKVNAEKRSVKRCRLNYKSTNRHRLYSTLFDNSPIWPDYIVNISVRKDRHDAFDPPYLNNIYSTRPRNNLNKQTIVRQSVFHPSHVCKP